MGGIRIINKEEGVKTLKKHLEDARSIAIDVCNHTYFPSKEYDNVLFLKESLDRLVVYCEKIILKNN
jgi:hypothetical protein